MPSQTSYSGIYNDQPLSPRLFSNPNKCYINHDLGIHIFIKIFKLIY